jgi:hypothetical protein
MVELLTDITPAALPTEVGDSIALSNHTEERKKQLLATYELVTGLQVERLERKVSPGRSSSMRNGSSNWLHSYLAVLHR